MNTNEAVALLWLVKAHWPHFTIFGTKQLPLQAGAWLDVLGDIPLADARGAVANLAVSGREFPPTAGQVRLEALRLRSTSGAPEADRALAEVLGEIRRVGYVGAPVWTHPAIGEAVAAMGGWQETCCSDNPEAFRAHFMRVYGTAAERHQRHTTAPRVVAELTEALANGLQLPAARQPGTTP